MQTADVLKLRIKYQKRLTKLTVAAVMTWIKI